MTTADTHRSDVARYYRWLDRLAWMREKRGETGSQAQPVHRALRDPDGGPDSALVVHRLMFAGLDLPAAPRVLDAGCGYGATMLDLAPQLGGEWLGLTLSDVQAARGNAEAATRGLSGLRIQVGSYDAVLPGPFDWICAIESLIHSPDPGATIGNLAGALAPGGVLTMVDDMPIADPTPDQAERIATFKRCWRCPVAPTREGWIAVMLAAGLRVIHEQDLTPLTLPRPAAELAPMIAARARQARIRRLFGLGYRSEADLGGMVLETLGADGGVRYRLISARKVPGG